MTNKEKIKNTHSSLTLLNIAMILVCFVASLGVSIVYFSQKVKQDETVITNLISSNEDFRNVLLKSQQEMFDRRFPKKKQECEKGGYAALKIQEKRYAESKQAAATLFDSIKLQLDEELKKYEKKSYFIKSIDFSINEDSHRHRRLNADDDADKALQEKYMLRANIVVNFTSIDNAQTVYKNLITTGLSVDINGSVSLTGNCFEDEKVIFTRPVIIGSF